MDCPHCGTDGSYTGLQWVHCQNEKCKYYDARYTEKVRREMAAGFYDSVDRLILLRGEIQDPEEDS